MKMKRITIREKKVTVVRMLIGTLKKSLELMEQDIKRYEDTDKVLLEVTMDAHFEKIRCDSGNLNEVLENNRIALNIMFEANEI